MAPKSILKKTTAFPGDGDLIHSNVEKPKYTARHREIALYHANLIQQQKDGELKITLAVEELIDFPLNTSNPASPAKSDIDRFCDLIKSFTAADYDDLLEERNLADRCAYTLCPNAMERQKPKAKYHLKFSGSGEVNAIPSSSIRQWCSQACARRALYIKVQLAEVPHWERQGDTSARVELLTEKDDGLLTQKMTALDSSKAGQDKLQEAMDELALERGEDIKSVNPRMVMENRIVENTSSQTVPLPPVLGQDEDFSQIEGYKIGVDFARKRVAALTRETGEEQKEIL